MLALFLSASAQAVEDRISNLDQLKTENIEALKESASDLLQESLSDDQKNKVLVRLAEGHILFNDHDVADRILRDMNLKPSDELYPYFLVVRGRIEYSRKRINESLETFYEAIALAKARGLAELEPEIYADVAAVLRENNDLENCTKYYRFALEKARENDNVDLQVKAAIQLCKVFNGWITVNLDSSVYYGEMALEIAEENNYKYGYVSTISILSAPIIRQGNYRRGLEMSKEGLLYADEYNLPLINKYYMLANLGFAYEGLKMYDSALYFMKLAGDLRPHSLDYPRLRYKILKAQGQYEDALAALELYHSKSDSIQRNRNKTSLSSLQARLEADLKDQEVRSLQQTAEYQRIQIIGLAIVLVVSMGIVVLLFRQRKLRSERKLALLELEDTKERLNLERQQRASELKAIRSQMNPHFVFNALNSIQDYIMSNERKLAGKYLGKFADLMRVFLEHSQAKQITLKEEMDALNLYLELEKLRFEDSMTYQINVEDSVDQEILIPSLILQPHVENAIKHGLLHKEGSRELTISIRNLDRAVCCVIEDNGIGRTRSAEINHERNPGHKSFGMEATKSRLELLNYDRDDPILEKIEDAGPGENPGTRVTITIPHEP